MTTAGWGSACHMVAAIVLLNGLLAVGTALRGGVQQRQELSLLTGGLSSFELSTGEVLVPRYKMREARFATTAETCHDGRGLAFLHHLTSAAARVCTPTEKRILLKKSTEAQCIETFKVSCGRHSLNVGVLKQLCASCVQAFDGDDITL
eukprot:CAMPEP_0175960776 /NCGR_PEP_ID=MMETSP0108-20121206/35561_1 /TAXON_ID=195067 ORGANISM="Goniomonas pacifica, Strain CCMP1869" /NCGR_SAMPLE_ID=MMETSP0108 /ASSEMBLY_ACC=CAM_ASM_000204 /LENGTH=148 /DNA_ID=CAMNT_0017288419 /DNA_START=112 /DNA_END=558 /DNA_ORIENTATION=+